ncbi:MAG: DUF3604 domain-containing protein [Novosphingobium sp.]
MKKSVALLAGLAAIAVSHGAFSGTPAPESRRAFFGELHLHTGYSFDAYALMGSRAEPDMAWRFAMGEPVEYLGQTVRRSRPLDFMALTDHAEYLGASMRGLSNPETPFARSKAGQLMLQDPIGAAMGKLVAAITGDEDSRREMTAVNTDSWNYQQSLVEKYNKPGTFTTFAAYEWTSMWDGKYNMHRNVIFRDKAPEAPFTAADSTKPEDLWAFLESQRFKGIEGLAIPHNSNASGGNMFDWNMSNGKPIDAAYAFHRAMNEPLAEIFQHKGQSETSPLLSPADEFADFERAEELLGSGGGSKLDGSFVRQALGRGMAIESKIGGNPFKLGFVAASDFHNGLSDSAENAYAGNSLFSTDPQVNLPDRAFARKILSQTVGAAKGQIEGFERQRRIGLQQQQAAQLNWSSGGLTGVWAEENSRPAIYAALRRKETFATSGTQVRLRMFGGWNFPDNMRSSVDWVRSAYRLGVPMGGDLPASGSGAPSFLIEAAKDPAGANLDRIQVIKIWLEGDSYKEKVFDVAWSSERQRDPATGKLPPVRNTVDLRTARYTNSVGATVLSGQWRDPEFDPAKPAVYYARVLEIPTPRWTTLLAAARRLPLSKGVPATIQERAITSPIWYNSSRGK